MMVYAVGSILVLPLMYASGQMEVGLTLNLLIPALEEGFLFQVLQGLDVFVLWTALLLGWGQNEFVSGVIDGAWQTFFWEHGWGLCSYRALLLAEIASAKQTGTVR